MENLNWQEILDALSKIPVIGEYIAPIIVSLGFLVLIVTGIDISVSVWRKKESKLLGKMKAVPFLGSLVKLLMGMSLTRIEQENSVDKKVEKIMGE